MKKVELILWFKCNCRCVFCAVEPAAAKQSMDTASAVAHLERSFKDGARAVDFGGGEPTLRADLVELAQAAKGIGYRKIGLKTNGLRLAYPDFVERLLGAGISRFAVPVWGHEPDVHDRLCRTRGAFEMLEMGVKNVLDLGGELEADVLLTRVTAPRLAELVERFTAVGVRRFNAWLYCLFGSGYMLPSLMPTLTDAGRAVAEAAAALRDGARLATTQIPPCFLGPYAGLYYPIAGLGLRIVTPGGSFPAESSPFEAGKKTARCRGCANYKACAGVRPEYLERYSDKEIVRIAR